MSKSSLLTLSATETGLTKATNPNVAKMLPEEKKEDDMTLLKH